MSVSNISLAKYWHWLAILLAVFISLDSTVKLEAASNNNMFNIITVPAATCNCSITMACSCCQSVTVNIFNMTKALCITAKINILQLSAQVYVTLDGNTMTTIPLDLKAMTSMCMPFISDFTPMIICLKVKNSISGLTSITICPSFYSSISNQTQLFNYNFPCLKMGTSGVSLA